MRIVEEQYRFLKARNIGILILSVVSVILVAFQFAFQHDITIAGSILLYSIDLFFIINILLLYKRGSDSGAIIFHIVAAFPFDVLFLFWGGWSIEGISIILWVRMLRLIRLKYIFSIINNLRYISWINPGYLRISKFFLIIIILGHFVACAWYVAAYFSGFPANSWVLLSGIHEAGHLHAYLRSLYWAVTTLTTVGYGDITPHLDYEYIIAIITMASGAFMYAFIIGNIASIISNLDRQKASFRSKVDTMSIYLKKRGIPRSLNNRIKNYYEYVWLHHRGFDEYYFLRELPDHLQLDVLLHLTKELLVETPIFKYSSEELKHVLVMALQARTYDPGSYVARAGHKGKEMYFISKGRIEIQGEPGTAALFTLKPGDYFGDLSMLTGEMRTANAVAHGFCEIFVLHAKDFNRIKEEYPDFVDVLSKISSQKSDLTAKMILEGIVL